MPEVRFDGHGVTLFTGDAATVLAELPSRSVDCVVTSPPYWGLRDYGTAQWSGGDQACAHLTAAGSRCRRCGARRSDQQHGLEANPQDYVDRLRAVFRELSRVLVSTGTAWLDLGDSYAADPPGRTADGMRSSTLSGYAAAAPLRESVRRAGVRRTRALPRKNLVGIPWRVAFALQDDGWILRSAIVWHKPNAIPESVRDRVSTRYEMVFMLTQQRHYHFNLDPIREPAAGPPSHVPRLEDGVGGKYTCADPFPDKPHGHAMRPTGRRHTAGSPQGRNPGDVWSISTRPLREAHFAAFPIDLPLRCIAAGCPDGGTVLDPFSGAATTGIAARQLGRRYVGIDLNPDFHDIGLRRLGLRSTSGRSAA